MPGLVVQAQAIQQLLDGRPYRDFGPIGTFAICFICGLMATLMITVKVIRRYIPFLSTVGLILFMIVDVVLYKGFAYNFPGNLAGAAFLVSLLFSWLALLAGATFTEELPETLELIEKVIQ
jgi:hypothetical protein